MDDLRIFCGTSNAALAGRIVESLGLELGSLDVRHFADGEISVKVNVSVRGRDVFIVQSTCSPVNDNLIELLIMIDAFRRASARRITAVLPYYGYGRQDKKLRPREPITARLVANLITMAGANRVLCMDLHAGQIQGFFDIPVDHLQAGQTIGEDLIRCGYDGPGTVVVSPDVGGVTRARALAEQLHSPIAIIAKRRPAANKVEILEVVGDIEGKVCVMIDDMIDTGGSIVKGAEELLRRGAASVHACCTHGVLSKDAVQNVEISPIASLTVTDTIPHPVVAPNSKLRVLSVAALFAEAIWRIHTDSSVSQLFEQFSNPQLRFDDAGE